MSESRHSQGDAANVPGDATPGHVDEFAHVPSDEAFVGALEDVKTRPYALDPDEIAEHFNRTKLEREQRRKRRHRLERIRAWVILLGGLLLVALMFSPLPGIYAAGVLLAVCAGAIGLRRAGQ